MGQMIAGKWVTDAALGSVTTKGDWKRTPSVVRNWIGDEDTTLPPTAGRYHLYAAWNCPWAHRVLLVRAVLGLEDVISVSMVAPRRTDQGWVLDPSEGYVDDIVGASALHQVYGWGDANYTGRVTVPLLVDKRNQRLVSNESADLVRMLPQAFKSEARTHINLCPAALETNIDEWNAVVHRKLNNGVYRTGFAETQTAYDAAVEEVFEALETLERHLADRPYMLGDDLTETDLRLFPTLARFDVAYHTAFKCSWRRLIDYQNLWLYARRIYSLPGVAETVKFDIYRRGYFSASEKRNPLGIIPVAPDISWEI
jgi:putative glutathione S-transferase